MSTTTSDKLFYIFSGIIILMILVILLIGLVYYLTGFSQELRYINDEIKRTTGSERKNWKRKKRRLWLSLLPFVKY